MKEWQWQSGKTNGNQITTSAFRSWKCFILWLCQRLAVALTQRTAITSIYLVFAVRCRLCLDLACVLNFLRHSNKTENLFAIFVCQSYLLFVCSEMLSLCVWESPIERLGGGEEEKEEETREEVSVEMKKIENDASRYSNHTHNQCLNTFSAAFCPLSLAPSPVVLVIYRVPDLWSKHEYWIARIWPPTFDEHHSLYWTFSILVKLLFISLSLSSLCAQFSTSFTSHPYNGTQPLLIHF